MEKTALIQKTTLDYDEESDVLYISFGGPQHADDSEVTDEGVIIRLKEGRIIGFTIPNAKKKIHA